MDSKLYTYSLVALIASIGVIIFACLQHDEFLLAIGIMGFAVNGYCVVVVPRLMDRKDDSNGK